MVNKFATMAEIIKYNQQNPVNEALTTTITYGGGPIDTFKRDLKDVKTVLHPKSTWKQRKKALMNRNVASNFMGLKTNYVAAKEDAILEAKNLSNDELVEKAFAIAKKSDAYKKKTQVMDAKDKKAFDNSIIANLKTNATRIRGLSKSSTTAIFVLLALIVPVLTIDIWWVMHVLDDGTISRQDKELVAAFIKKKKSLTETAEEFNGEYIEEANNTSDEKYINMAMEKMRTLPEYKKKMKGKSKEEQAKIDGVLRAKMKAKLPKAKSVAKRYALGTFGKVLVSIIGIVALNTLIVTFILLTSGIGIIFIYPLAVLAAFDIADMLTGGKASTMLRKIAEDNKDIINEAGLPGKVNGKTTPNDMVALLKKNGRANKMAWFAENTRNFYLNKAINCVVDSVLESFDANQHEYDIAHGFVEKFVNEEGYYDLTRKFYRQNLLLSEMARHAEMYAEDAINEAILRTKDIQNPEDICFTIDQNTASEFTNKIQELIPSRTIDVIQGRVSNSISKFMQQAIDQKDEIKRVYMRANSKITKLSPEEEKLGLKEQYIQDAKIKAGRMYDRPSTLLEAMVIINQENVYKDEALKDFYLNESGDIDTGSIINDTVAMYTVLETFNTTEMVKITPEYIKNMLVDLKG